MVCFVSQTTTLLYFVEVNADHIHPRASASDLQALLLKVVPLHYKAFIIEKSLFAGQVAQVAPLKDEIRDILR